MTNVQLLQQDFETYLRIKKLIEEGYKYEDLVRKYDSLSDAASDIGVSRKALIYAHKHKDPLSLGVKVEPKYSLSSGLRIISHPNIYPSWININMAGQGLF